VVSTSGSASPSFGQSTASADFLLAFATSNNPGSSFPLSLSGSGWSLVASGGGSYNWAGLWMKENCSSSESAPSFSDSGSSVMAASLAEFSGVATSSPLDHFGVYYGFPAGATASGVNAQDNDLVVGLATFNGSNASPTVGIGLVGSTNFALTNTAWLSNSNGNADEPFWGFAYGVDAYSSASYAQAVPNSVVPTISEYENAPVCIVASFKAA
jgi:hypothetical protein